MPCTVVVVVVMVVVLYCHSLAEDRSVMSGAVEGSHSAALKEHSAVQEDHIEVDLVVQSDR